MNNEDFKKLLKEANLTKTSFAEYLGTSNQVINNWNTNGREIPYWVESWLNNYIKAKKFEDIKSIICAN